MKILLTGFQPFDRQKVNPSWEAVKNTDVANISADIKRVCLPVEWTAAPKVLTDAIREYNPDAVLMTGQAGGRCGISIERLAVNMCDAKIPDNIGEERHQIPIKASAPFEYKSTYEYERILSSLEKENINAHYSFDAGKFICNLVLYTALDYVHENRPDMKVGFIHFPYLPEQTKDKPSMSADEQLKALNIIIKSLI